MEIGVQLDANETELLHALSMRCLTPEEAQSLG